MEFPKKDLTIALSSIVEALEDIRTKLVYKIIIETSCKVSELSNLRVKNISSNKITFNIREVPISKNLSSLILFYINQEGLSPSSFLFKTRQSDSISPKRIRQIIQKTSEEHLGFKITPNHLREYSIKEKLNGKNIEVVKNEVGLKRIDKRKYLSLEQVTKIEEKIKIKRDYLIFKLLLNNFKSSEIVNFKVEDILDSSISKKFVNELESYAVSKGISFGEYLFNTRQETHLTNERIFQIIFSLGKEAGIKTSPRILNNTAIANALFSKDSKSKLKALGVKTRATDIRRGLFKNE